MGSPSLLSLYTLLIRSVIVGIPILVLSLLTVLPFQYLKLQRRTVVKFPILRHLPSLICNINRLQDWIVDWFKESGTGTIVFHGPVFAGMEIVCTCDPQNIEYMTKTNFGNFDKGPHFAEMFDFLGNGIFNADGESWFLQRKMAVSRFVSKSFRSFSSEKMEEVVREGLLPVLQDAAKRSTGSIVDLQDVFKRFAFDATFASVFGRNPGFLSVNYTENEFSNALDTLTRVAFLRHTLPSFCWKTMRFLGLGWEKRYNQALGALDRHLAEFISVKKQELADGKLPSDDLLATYMRSNEETSIESIGGDSSNTTSVETFLRDTALTFMFAGQDTVGSGLTWFFWLLSKTPSVEAKILEELKLVVSSADEQYLNKLKYLEAAILESMRLYPPVPIEHKSTKEEDVFPDGTVVRPGNIIMFSLFAMGRMEWIWGEDCLDFKPERWVDEKDGSVKHESASKYPVFNVGPRACLGKRMGMTMMKAVIAALLPNFRVNVVEGQSVRPVPSVILKMKDGLKVTITDRKEEFFD